MQRKTIHTILWVTIFSIAMGMLESAVVVYLRALYYPEGFAFPLKTMEASIAVTELLREAATLTMLIGIGVLSGRSRIEKFGYFIFSFAIWDIFYYVFLKTLLHWPESWLTWDILFLIPTTWVGPVIAPVILSLLMIILALCISYFQDKLNHVQISWREWSLLIFGSLTVIVSFTLEYTQFLLKEFSFGQMFRLTPELLDYAIQFIPRQFPWTIFILGTLLIVSGIAVFIYRNQKAPLSRGHFNL